MTVKIYNINKGKNLPLLQKSKSLDDYAKAIQWCIKQDILKHFLEEHGSEVENMVFGEWDMDTALEVAKVVKAFIKNEASYQVRIVTQFSPNRPLKTPHTFTFDEEIITREARQFSIFLMRRP